MMGAARIINANLVEQQAQGPSCLMRRERGPLARRMEQEMNGAIANLRAFLRCGREASGSRGSRPIGFSQMTMLAGVQIAPPCKPADLREYPVRLAFLTRRELRGLNPMMLAIDGSSALPDSPCRHDRASIIGAVALVRARAGAKPCRRHARPDRWIAK